jgi:hypothetical protein
MLTLQRSPALVATLSGSIRRQPRAALRAVASGLLLILSIFEVQ